MKHSNTGSGNVTTWNYSMAFQAEGLSPKLFHWPPTVSPLWPQPATQPSFTSPQSAQRPPSEGTACTGPSTCPTPHASVYHFLRVSLPNASSCPVGTLLTWPLRPPPYCPAQPGTTPCGSIEPPRAFELHEEPLSISAHQHWAWHWPRAGPQQRHAESINE